MPISKWKETLHATTSDYNTEPCLYIRHFEKDEDGDRQLYDFDLKFKEFELYAVWRRDKDGEDGV